MTESAMTLTDTDSHIDSDPSSRFIPWERWDRSKFKKIHPDDSKRELGCGPRTAYRWLQSGDLMASKQLFWTVEPGTKKTKYLLKSTDTATPMLTMTDPLTVTDMTGHDSTDTDSKNDSQPSANDSGTDTERILRLSEKVIEISETMTTAVKTIESVQRQNAELASQNQALNNQIKATNNQLMVIKDEKKFEEKRFLFWTYWQPVKKQQ